MLSPELQELTDWAFKCLEGWPEVERSLWNGEMLLAPRRPGMQLDYLVTPEMETCGLQITRVQPWSGRMWATVTAARLGAANCRELRLALAWSGIKETGPMGEPLPREGQRLKTGLGVLGAEEILRPLMETPGGHPARLWETLRAMGWNNEGAAELRVA